MQRSSDTPWKYSVKPRLNER
ncbi:hypothetical protein EMIT0P2_10383 [Pseudomonas sp. IT-P2]